MSDSPNNTCVLFRAEGGLVLDAAQEERVQQMVGDLHAHARKSMGWEDNKSFNTFLAIRKQAWAEFENDFEHRRNDSRYSALYREFNTTLNIPKRAILVAHAKACNQLVNSDPFVSLLAEGEEDESDGLTLADRVWRNNLELGKCKYGLRNGALHALVGGEGIEKIGMLAMTPYSGPKSVKIWVDANNTPIKDSKGNWITDKDEWEKVPDELDAWQLKRDPQARRPEGAKVSKQDVEAQDITREDILNFEPVHYSDFVCDPLEPDIHTAEYIAHVFDIKLDKLLDQLKDLEITESGKAWAQAQVNNQDNTTQSDAAKPEDNRKAESDADRTVGMPVVTVVESWCRIDCDMTGYSKELCVVWDYKTKELIFYGEMDKVSPTKRRPFRVLRVIPVRGRWYGMGFYQYLQNEHGFIDRMINRVDARSSRSGGIHIVRAGVFKEQKQGIPIVPGPRLYTLEAKDQDIEKVITTIPLQEMDGNIWSMLQTMQQNAQLMTGGMTPQDAQASKMPTTGTLGELQSIQADANLLSDNATMDLQSGIMDCLRDSLGALFYHLKDQEEPPGEIANLLGGDKAEIFWEWLKNTDVERLYNTVKPTLSKAFSPDEIQKLNEALAMIVGPKTWEQLCMESPEIAEAMLPMYSSILTARKVPNANRILKQVLEQAKAVVARQQQEAMMLAQSQAPPTTQ